MPRRATILKNGAASTRNAQFVLGGERPPPCGTVEARTVESRGRVHGNGLVEGFQGTRGRGAVDGHLPPDTLASLKPAVGARACPRNHPLTARASLMRAVMRSALS